MVNATGGGARNVSSQGQSGSICRSTTPRTGLTLEKRKSHDWSPNFDQIPGVWSTTPAAPAGDRPPPRAGPSGQRRGRRKAVQRAPAQGYRTTGQAASARGAGQHHHDGRQQAARRARQLEWRPTATTCRFKTTIWRVITIRSARCL